MMKLRIHSGPSGPYEFVLSPGVNLVGRHHGCDVPILDEQVSWEHAELIVAGSGRVLLRDLGSTNGTFVNGEPINGARPLAGDEELQFGNTIASVIADADEDVDGEPQWWRSNLAIALSGVSLLLFLVLMVFVLSGGGTLSPGQVADRVRPSTVLVTTDGEHAGSGWVFDARQGIVVTNAHVIEGGSTFAVGDGDSSRDAALVGVAACEDIAVLRTNDAQGLVSISLGSQSDLHLGDQVIAMGFPISLASRPQLTVTGGSVSVVSTAIGDYPDLVQTDAALNPGNSGGPLVDMRGRLVGVNVTKTVSEFIEGQGYAIGVDRVKEVVPAMLRGEDPCF